MSAQGLSTQHKVDKSAALEATAAKYAVYICRDLNLSKSPSRRKVQTAKLEAEEKALAEEREQQRKLFGLLQTLVEAELQVMAFRLFDLAFIL